MLEDSRFRKIVSFLNIMFPWRIFSSLESWLASSSWADITACQSWVWAPAYRVTPARPTGSQPMWRKDCMKVRCRAKMCHQWGGWTSNRAGQRRPPSEVKEVKTSDADGFMKNWAAETLQVHVLACVYRERDKKQAVRKGIRGIHSRLTDNNLHYTESKKKDVWTWASIVMKPISGKTFVSFGAE